MDIPKIKTKFDHVATPLIKQMLKERGLPKQGIESDGVIWWVLQCEANYFEASCLVNGDWHRNHKIVPLSEFIYELGKIQLPPKSIVIDVLPWEVAIRGDKVDIGCKTNIDILLFEKTMAKIEDTDALVFFGIDIVRGRRGFKANGQFVSWDTWDAFCNAYQEATKKENKS